MAVVWFGSVCFALFGYFAKFVRSAVRPSPTATRWPAKCLEIYPPSAAFRGQTGRERWSGSGDLKTLESSIEASVWSIQLGSSELWDKLVLPTLEL